MGIAGTGCKYKIICQEEISSIFHNFNFFCFLLFKYFAASFYNSKDVMLSTISPANIGLQQFSFCRIENCIHSNTFKNRVTLHQAYLKLLSDFATAMETLAPHHFNGALAEMLAYSPL